MNDNISSISVESIVPHGQWITSCCLGQVSPSSDCANYADPQGSDCQAILGKYCSSRDNFFSPTCQTWLQNLNSAYKNQIANAVCPQAQTQTEKDWCACYHLSDIPPELASNPEIVALWPCLNSTCNSSAKALQPYAKNCPTTLAICTSNVVQTLAQTTIGANKIQNLCGNITLTPTVGPATPSAPVIAPPTVIVPPPSAPPSVVGGPTPPPPSTRPTTTTDSNPPSGQDTAPTATPSSPTGLSKLTMFILAFLFTLGVGGAVAYFWARKQ